MIERYALWLQRHRFAVLLAVLALVGWAASGARFLQFTTDYRVFFSAQNPQLQAFETLQNTYTKNDNILFVLAPQDGQVFTREVLAAIVDLTHAAWKIPYSLRVDSITNFQYTRAAGDDLIVTDLIEDPEALDMDALRAIQDIALAEPLLVRRLISPQGHVTGVNVTIQLPGIHPEAEVPEAVTYARQLAERVRAAHPDIAVHLTGIMMMNNAFAEASQQDMATLVPVMFLVIVAALWFLLRSGSAVFATLSVVVLAILATLGIVGWLGYKITPPSSAAPTIIMTLAVADSVHILVSFLYYLRHGRDQQAAMTEALRVNVQPVAITSLTTAVGLLAMNFSESPPFRDLGNFVALGVTLAFLLAMTFLPALVLSLPVRRSDVRAREELAMDWLANFVLRHRRRLFRVNLVVIGVLCALVWRNELNDQFVQYFDEQVDFRRATDFTTRELTGIYNVDYSLPAAGSQAISEPTYLAKLDEFTHWLRAQPEVIHVNSLTDVMRRLNKNLHADDPEKYRIPESRELAAQYLLLYEISLPYGLDLNNQINVDKSATRLSITVQDMTSNALIAFERRARDWLRSQAPPHMLTEGSSPGLMFSHITQRNLASMITGNLWSIALIGITMMLAFRSLRYGLIGIIPNVLPIVMGFGVWALIEGQIGLALSVGASMTLGIVVDDTIHYLSKYLRARREQGLAAGAAVRHVFSSIGTAMWVLTVVLMAGFLVLAFSSFKMNAQMGLLTALTFGLALAADFLFLGPMLLKFEERRDAKMAAAAAAEPAAS